MDEDKSTTNDGEQLDLPGRVEKVKELGDEQFRKGAYEAAIEFYSEAITNNEAALNPNEPSYLTNRAVSYTALKRFGPALSDCQSAASLQSASPVAKTLLRLARCHLALGDTAACLAALRDLPGETPGVLEVRRKAESLDLHLKRFKEASEKDEWGVARLALEQAVDSLEGDVPAQWKCWRVECEVARGSWAGAQNAVSDALRLAPNSPDVLTLRAQTMFLTNQIPKAVQHAQHALRLDPDHTPAQQLMRRAREVERIKEEGNTLFKANRLGEAVERYGEALDVVGTKVREGKLQLLQLKQLEPALEDTNASLALNPDSYKALRTRGRIQLELEHFEEAVRDFKSAEEAAEAENAAIGEQRALAGETRQAEVLLKRSKTKDNYKILNERIGVLIDVCGADVSRDCSDSDIKKAYRRESLIHHPDKGGDEEKFKLIGEVNAVLSDPQRRRRSVLILPLTQALFTNTLPIHPYYFSPPTHAHTHRYDAGGDEDGSNDGGPSMEDMMGGMGGGMHMNLAEMLAQMQGGGGRAGFGFGGPFGGAFGGHGHGHGHSHGHSFGF
ncbi:hypothetical protein FRC09_002585 [Ceratobasidium sp. 395]|nr:hypothetical protein FRC09_002585 [Ceratobasidium sp. 395]